MHRVLFNELHGWAFQPGTGDLVHESGKFFSVRGLHVGTSHGPVTHWSQPIIDQHETGILGLLLRRFKGVPHCLMQAKMEPGNNNGLQLSPTVRATRSNYTQVHRGSRTRYLEHFTRGPGRVLVDVLQSEQGGWFLHKRNRNMAVEIPEDAPEVPVADGFRWVPLAHLRRLLHSDTWSTWMPAACCPDSPATTASSALTTLVVVVRPARR